MPHPTLDWPRWLALAAISISISASQARAQTSPPTAAGLACFARAYPEAVCQVQADSLVLCDGQRLGYDDARDKSHAEQLEQPDLQDTLAQPYPAFAEIRAPAPDIEPGRVRLTALLQALYGKSPREVSAQLTQVAWLPAAGGKPLRFMRRHGAAQHLAAVASALGRAPLALQRTAAEVAGSVSFRNIAGTERTSAHAFGIALDIAPALADYFRWREPLAASPSRYRNRIPQEIVSAFEREGFIWGGRWHHYDTMHFEYRPELLQPGCVAPPPAAPPPAAASSEAPPLRPHYAFPHAEPSTPLAARIAPPAGFTRIPLAADGFGAFLRGLPLAAGRGQVTLFDGRPKPSQRLHAAVLDIDVGRRDLQQCADAVMRLRAEYLWSAGRAAEVCFRAASGDAMRYAAYRRGERPPAGRAAPWLPRTAADDSWSGFRSYLDGVFNLANTASLTRELRPLPDPRSLEPGDVYIEPARGARYGHAVLVLDAAQDAQGERVFLIAQSYMPAQSIHVLVNPGDPALSPWYRAPADGSLETPEWSFPPASLRRFDGSCK